MTARRLWAGLLLLGLLSPLGLYGPQWLGAGAAWGEWGLDEIRAVVGYVPAGMAQSAERWSAPLTGYGAAASEGWLRPGLAYLLSAFLGMGACAGLAYGLGRWLSRGGR